MKKFRSLLNENSARNTARFMKWICYAVVVFTLFGIILSIIGRQEFILHTPTGAHQHAMFANENRDWQLGEGVQLGSVRSRGEFRIITDSSGEVDFILRVALTVAHLVVIIPMLFAFWILSRLFKNISDGRIFVYENAHLLLYFGVIQAAALVIAPFIQLFITEAASSFASGRITFANDPNFLVDAIPYIAVIVAAYIIHHGAKLQDEADHTL